MLNEEFNMFLQEVCKNFRMIISQLSRWELGQSINKKCLLYTRSPYTLWKTGYQEIKQWNNLSVDQQLACQVLTELCASVLLVFTVCPCSHLPHPFLPGPFLHKWATACLYSEGSRLRIQFNLLAWLQWFMHGQPFHFVPLPYIT